MKKNHYYKAFQDYAEKNKMFPKNSFVYILLSGGKDSTAMSYLFREYVKKRKNVSVKYVNAAFPGLVFGSTKKEKNICLKHIAKGLKSFISLRAESTDEELAKSRDHCLFCKHERRKSIKELILQDEKNDLHKNKKVIIATAHTSEDLMAYFIEFFKISPEELINKRTSIKKISMFSSGNALLSNNDLEHLSKFIPKIKLKSGIILAHPMLFFSRTQIEDFLKESRIKACLKPCPYAIERPKRAFFKLIRSLPRKENERILNSKTHKELLSIVRAKAKDYKSLINKIKNKEFSELLL